MRSVEELSSGRYRTTEELDKAILEAGATEAEEFVRLGLVLPPPMEAKTREALWLETTARPMPPTRQLAMYHGRRDTNRELGLFSVDDIAAMHGFNCEAVWRQFKKGKLPNRSFDSSYAARPDDVDAWLPDFRQRQARHTRLDFRR